MKTQLISLGIALTLIRGAGAGDATDPLPSWNDTIAKRSIVAFVDQVTTKDSPRYVLPAERIATFDNDGTLWSEQPFYFQLAFALDRVKAMVPDHPEWKDQQPFKAALEDDRKRSSLVARSRS